MRVCKHGCDINMFCFLRANHASTNLKKVVSWKISRQLYFIYLFPRRLKLEKSLETCCVKFFCLSWHLSEKSILFGKQGLIKCTSFEYKTSRLVTISLLISALNNRVLLFFLGKLFHKSTRKCFSCVCTRRAGRILDHYANPRLRLGFA